MILNRSIMLEPDLWMVSFLYGVLHDIETHKVSAEEMSFNF